MPTNTLLLEWAQNLARKAENALQQAAAGTVPKGYCLAFIEQNDEK